MKKIITMLYAFILLSAITSSAQGLSTGIDPNFTFEGSIGESVYVLKIELDMSGSGDFTGKMCSKYDLEEFGDQDGMWNIVKGHFNNETEEMIFAVYFHGQNNPYAIFSGMWGETSDGEGMHGELTTLSINQVEDVHLYEREK